MLKSARISGETGAQKKQVTSAAWVGFWVGDKISEVAPAAAGAGPSHPIGVCRAAASWPGFPAIVWGEELSKTSVTPTTPEFIKPQYEKY
jgi:hypothetical protein